MPVSMALNLDLGLTPGLNEPICSNCRIENGRKGNGRENRLSEPMDLGRRICGC